MNDLVVRRLFMPELCCLSPHSTWGQPGLTSTTCGTLRKLLKRLKKLKNQVVQNKFTLIN